MIDVTESSFMARIPEPNIRELYGLWRDGCRDGKPPFRDDFKIQSTPYRLWPYLFYYNVTEEGRYFCVHNGTEVVRYFGNETTGHYMDDFISEEFAKSVRSLYDGAIAKGRGVYYRGDLQFDTDAYYIYSRLLLPIRGTDGANKHILGIMTVTGEERTYLRPISMERRDIMWDDSFGA